ncbi:MAG: type II secretion system protein [Candidatus Margulisiibacteriota bacterium]|nr:type II secretion system protein [Candidatus Margulisiibacteriota bacterium]
MKNKRGFSLIEVVISITVLAIVLYALIAVFITTGVKGVNVEIFTVAQSLAEGKLEETMALSFNNVTSESETNFSGNLSDFSYEIISNYVSGEALDTPVGYSTDYKKIEVLIRHPDLGIPTTLESIRSDV